MKETHINDKTVEGDQPIDFKELSKTEYWKKRYKKNRLIILIHKFLFLNPIFSIYLYLLLIFRYESIKSGDVCEYLCSFSRFKKFLDPFIKKKCNISFYLHILFL